MDEDVLAVVLREVGHRISVRPWDTPIHRVLEEIADEIEQEGVRRRNAEHMDSGR